jgi:hypothetical protein
VLAEGNKDKNRESQQEIHGKKSMKPRVDSEKRNKIDKPLPRLRKTERTQINEVTNESGDIVAEGSEMKGIIVKKLGNQEERGQFPHKYKLPRLGWEEAESPIRPITRK